MMMIIAKTQRVNQHQGEVRNERYLKMRKKKQKTDFIKMM